MNFETLLLPLLLFMILCVVLGVLLWILRQWTKSLSKNHELSLSILESNRNLLDRLMSQDLQTYATMTGLTVSSANSNPTDEYRTRSDLDEINAMNLAQTQGLGSVLYDDQTDMDDLKDLMNGPGANSLMGLLSEGGNRS